MRKEEAAMEEQKERQRYEKPELERLDGLQTVAVQAGGGCGCSSGKKPI